MPLSALAIGCPSQVLEKVVPVFDLAEIKTEICGDAAEAWRKLQQTKYDAAVLDCAQAPGWPEAMASLRRSGPNRACVIFAILDRAAAAREASGLGASLTLERNFAQSSLLRSLRAVYGLMLAERQRYYRHPLRTMVAVSAVNPPSRTLMSVGSCDISQGGLAVRGPLPFPVGSRVELEFDIPGPYSISSEGEVAWTDAEGQAGLRFTRMSQRSRDELTQWLKEEWERTQPPPAQIPLTLPFSRSGATGRRLRCHAFITQLPVGWRCSECSWQHYIRVEATSWRYAAHPPEMVMEAFERHICAEHDARGPARMELGGLPRGL